MESKVDGFYVGYMTGVAGNGLVLFTFLNDIIVGVDAEGVRFDGSYSTRADGNGHDVSVTIFAPPGGSLIQGVPTGPMGLTYKVDTVLPLDLEKDDFIKVQTPFGPVNMKLKKLREFT
jgi:hypothetical protein